VSKALLVVHHTPSPATRELLEAVLAGTHDPDIEGVDIEVRPALAATVPDMLNADGYLFGTPPILVTCPARSSTYLSTTPLLVGCPHLKPGVPGRRCTATSRGGPNGFGQTLFRWLAHENTVR
jgi:hypothetical protein